MIGSQWQKWDLHIHTPFTNQNNQYTDVTVNDFAQKIIDSELSLIGVTNYFYFADNELETLRNVFMEKDVKLGVLGNLEFRINQANKDGEWINIHIIFSDRLGTESINTTLSTLPMVNTTFDGKKIYCSDLSFRESQIKISEAVVDFNTLVDHLHSNLKFGIDFFIAACPNGYGGFRPDGTEGRSLAVALEIEKSCQIILGRPQDREFFLKEDRYQDAKPKPVFVTSDSHQINEIGSKYSWVKSKPKFEGFRQAIIEPKDRVQQEDDFIENTYIKPKFQTIEVGGAIFPEQDIRFTNQTLPLNPNMVAIIGGRGTGKSLLLDAIYSLFHDNTGTTNARIIDVRNVIIRFNQGDGTEHTFNSENNIYSYLHVSQGDIQSFSQNPEKLSAEIKRMLGIKDEEFNPIVSNELVDIIGKYRSFVDYWEAVDQNRNRINLPNYQDKIIEKIQTYRPDRDPRRCRHHPQLLHPVAGDYPEFRQRAVP